MSIDFPENELQCYRFTLRTTHYMVNANVGNFEVYYSDSQYMPAPMEGSWVLLDETDVLYWIGIVYAYKMTDDTTRNVYSSQDYRVMGAVCQMIDQVPDFEELEYMIGYSTLAGCSEYAFWSDRAKEWLENQRRWNNVPIIHPLAEGAD